MNTAERQQRSPIEAGAQASLSPAKFFETMNAHQRTSALKAAIDLGLFTVVGETAGGLAEISQRIKAPERGVRVLCDFMVISGFLNKEMGKSGPRYTLTPDSAAFLDRNSPAYVGGATVFLASPSATDGFKDLAAVVRAGGPPAGERIDTENPRWVDFAQGMAPVMYPVAEQVTKLLQSKGEARVLDIAAGHGLFGICVARANSKASIVAVDWPSVLAVAKQNAERFGVADRLALLPGNALEVPFGTGYDVALVTNLLHGWGVTTIHQFLKKVHAALAPNGRVVIVEFTPNDDRISPPIPASFAMNMFVNTPEGDVYTVTEIREMLQSAGFGDCEAHSLEPTPQTAIVALKKCIPGQNEGAAT